MTRIAVNVLCGAVVLAHPFEVSANEIRGIRDGFVMELSATNGSVCVLTDRGRPGTNSCADIDRDEVLAGCATCKDAVFAAAVARSDFRYMLTYYSGAPGATPIEQSDANEFAQRGLETYRRVSKIGPNGVYFDKPEAPSSIQNYGGAQTVFFKMNMTAPNNPGNITAVVLHYAVIGDTSAHHFEVVTAPSMADRAKADFEQALQTAHLAIPGSPSTSGGLLARLFGLVLAAVAVILAVKGQQSKSRARRQSRRRR
jgi:hypothetical protein